MFKYLIFFILFFLSNLHFGQTLSFPDPNFENALVNFEVVDTNGNGLGDSVCDTNGDGFIQLSEAQAVIGLIVSYYNIESLEGIEFFSNLETLKSRGNFLTALDLSQNAQLTWLHVETNPLSNLDISQNFLMERLWIYQNELTELDVSHMPQLNSLRVYSNPLESLNIQNGNNVALTNFLAYDTAPLYCIQVDDEAYANNQSEWQKDALTVYSEDCSLGSATLKVRNTRLYPNPTEKLLHVETSSRILAIYVYDLSGKLLLKLVPENGIINLDQLGAGYYLLKIEDNQGFYTKQIIKK